MWIQLLRQNGTHSKEWKRTTERHRKVHHPPNPSDQVNNLNDKGNAIRFNDLFPAHKEKWEHLELHLKVH